MAVPCVSIKLGGTVTDAGITGGIDIGDMRYQVNDWSNLWGSIPIRAAHQRIGGRAGRLLTGPKLPDWRLLTLNLRSMPWDPTGGYTDGAAYTDEECGQIIENLLTMVGLFGDGDPLVIEWVVDTARSLYLEAWTLTAAPVITQGKHRLISQTLEASYPYWKEDVLQTDTISGADTITNPGTAEIFDAILVFSGAGSFTNSTTGQVITTTAAAEIDVNNHLVLSGGVDVDGVAQVDGNQWMRFRRGVNNVVSTVSVDVKWRPAYK